MKILALVGTNANFSYNRILLQFMKKHFQQMADIEIYEISKLPAFGVDVPLSEQTEVWKLKQKVKAAGGVLHARIRPRDSSSPQERDGMVILPHRSFEA